MVGELSRGGGGEEGGVLKVKAHSNELCPAEERILCAVSGDSMNKPTLGSIYRSIKLK